MQVTCSRCGYSYDRGEHGPALRPVAPVFCVPCHLEAIPFDADNIAAALRDLADGSRETARGGS